MARRRRNPSTRYAMGRRRPPYARAMSFTRDPMGGPDPAPKKGSGTVTVRGTQYSMTAAQKAAWARRYGFGGGMTASGVTTGVGPRTSPTPTLSPTTPATGAPGAVSGATGGKGATTDPYAGLDPQLAQVLRQVDWEQRQHQQYLGFGPSGQPILGADGQQQGVMGWLANATKALAGISQAAGQNYNEQITRGVGGTYAAAAGAGTPSVAGRGPGGTYSPTEFESQGQRGLAESRGGAAQDMAAWQAMLATKLNVVRNQASLDALGDYAAGLPLVYAKRRLETRMDMEKYLADLEVRKEQAKEVARHNAVTEAQGAQNAMTNAAIAFGKLGISADKLALDAAGNPDASNGGTEPLPPGYVWAKNSKGGYDRVRDVSQTGSGASAKTPVSQSEQSYLAKGWTKIGAGRDPKKIDRTKFKVVQAGDTKAWMVIRRDGAGGTAAKTTEVKPVAKLGNDLKKLYKGSSDPLAADSVEGIQSRYPGDPNGAASEVADWFYSSRKQFTTANGTVDMSRLLQVLKIAVGPGSVSNIVGSLLAGKMSGKAPNRKWR